MDWQIRPLTIFLVGYDRSISYFALLKTYKPSLEETMTQTTQTMDPIDQRSLKTQVEALSLYDQDILLWVEDTVPKLKLRDFENLDLENLIDEVESLGISQHKELLSRLTRLLEHLLKRIYVPSPRDYNVWERTIQNQRSELSILPDKVPSLKSQWKENFDDAWQRALRNTKKGYPMVTFSNVFPFEHDLETILNADFW